MSFMTSKFWTLVTKTHLASTDEETLEKSKGILHQVSEKPQVTEVACDN